MTDTLSPLREEFRGLDLGDARLNRRAARIAADWMASPQKSFVDVSPSSAELEATYRFLGNDDVAYRDVLKPHVAATARRCSAHPVVLVLHDTTEFSFPGERDGLAEVGTAASTFFAHVALAVVPGELRVPLGVLSMEPFLSNGGSRGVLNRGAPKPTKTRAQRYAVPREEKESHRWDRGVDAAHAALTGAENAIHVCDREGDDFVLLAKLVTEKKRFVIRAEGTRRLADGNGRTSDVLEGAEHLFSRSAMLAPRRSGKGAHAARSQRLCRLGVRAACVEIAAPKQAQCEVPRLKLNVVQVFELEPPAGEAPVEWTLFTSEPIATPEDVEAIVDAYRSRWMIEEYFKAIKTGCAYEKRQLTTSHALLNALALCIPIAWQLLVIRTLGRSEQGEAPASSVLSQDQFLVLEVLAKKRKAKIPQNPTVRDAMNLIACVGGHLKRNGEPGWQTLGRGFQRLIDALEAVYCLREVGHLLGPTPDHLKREM